MRTLVPHVSGLRIGGMNNKNELKTQEQNSDVLPNACVHDENSFIVLEVDRQHLVGLLQCAGL